MSSTEPGRRAIPRLDILVKSNATNLRRRQVRGGWEYSSSYHSKPTENVIPRMEALAKSIVTPRVSPPKYLLEELLIRSEEIHI